MAVLKDLIVHGPSRFLNGANFNTINTESIGAEYGIFNKLVATSLDATTAKITDLTATNATVTALLDVQGDMQTNSWSNSNIATIDGSFYITPTSVSTDGADVTASNYTPTGTITYNSSNTNFTKIAVTGTFDTSQLTLNNATHVPWPAGSEVIITGDVLVGNEWLPLGTIRGKLENQVAATSASKEISIIPLSLTLSDGHGNKPIALEAIRSGINLTNGTSSALKMRKIKVSLTSRANGSTQYPVGILLTAQGTGTGQTFIDIYGGGEAKNSQSGTINGATKYFTKPTVRLGNLEGLPKLANQTPSGWGIYTSNGFFEGAIVAKEGYIGSTGSYWTIGGGTGSGATYIYCGPSTISATTTEGTYLGTNGFLNVSSSSTTGRPFTKITNGVITAQGANISGAITATSGTIGGWNIENSTGTPTYGGAIYTGTFGENGGIFITPDYYSGVEIGDSWELDPDNTAPMAHFHHWNIVVSNKFGVTSEGRLFSSEAFIGGFDISNHTFTAQQASGGYIKISCHHNQDIFSANYEYPNNMVPDADRAYFRVTDSGVLCAKGADITGDIKAQSFIAYDYYNSTYRTRAIVNTDGLTVYDGGGTADANKVAIFGSTVQVGKKAVGYITIDSTGIKIYKDDANNSIAQFGNITRIGKEASSQILINSNNFKIFDDAGKAPIFNCGSSSSSESVTFYESLNGISDNYLPTTWANGMSFSVLVISDLGQQGDVEDNHNFIVGTSKTSTTSSSTVIYNATNKSINWSSEGQSATADLYYTLTLKTPSFYYGTIKTAPGSFSCSLGRSLSASGSNQLVIGKYNSEDTNKAFIIGKGTSSTPSNALTVDWSGNVNIASGAKYQINGTALSASDVGAVPTTRTVNSKALSSNISLTASDVSAVPTSDVSTTGGNNKVIKSDSSGNVTITGNITSANLQVTTPTISITTGSGYTLNSYTVRKYGNIVQLHIRVRNNSSTTSGGNLYSGTINTTALRPIMITTSASYYSSYAFPATISTAGEIVVRNASTTAFSALTGTNYVNVSFTYIVA